MIAAGVERVVAAMQDPNPLVSGAGFRKLREAGVEVTLDSEHTEAAGASERAVRSLHEDRQAAGHGKSGSDAGR